MKTARSLLVYLLTILGPATVYGQLTAGFTASQQEGCAPFAVQFNNTSSGAVSYYWTFGNGNTSTLQHPSNTYTVPGQYTVTLTVTGANGASTTSTQTNFINVVAYPQAAFTANTTSSCPGTTVFHFTNQSTGAASYTWDFGDGTTSNDVNPDHVYHQSGTFTVTLIAQNIFGCQDVKTRNQYITIFPQPDATIGVNSTFGCDVNTVFQFSNGSTNITTWQWTFGDGTTSNQPNPTHQFNNNGTFNVNLTLTNSYGCVDVSDGPLAIRVGPGYYPGVSMDQDTGCVPLTVQFNNPNQNVATCVWNFGDGNTSTVLRPNHTYTAPGTFPVTLTITANDGCQVIATSQVYVMDKPSVSFTYSNTTGCAPLTVSFTNNSQNYDSCRWLFGDGSSSYLNNPTHTYTAGGSFSVTLQCWNAAGCTRADAEQNLINVTTTQAAYTADQRMGCPPLDVNFTALTQGSNLTYFWNFGDGTTSNLANPSHTYSTSGAFDVTLIVSDPIGCTDTLFRGAYIQTLNPTAGYTPPPTTVGCAPLTTQFTDATFGAVSWLWNFGDGNTSTQQNPSHTYSTPGFYNVSLTTTSAGGGCVQTISNFSSFDVRGGYAGFSNSTTACPPYIVQLTDTSLNAVSWFWNFGDGTTSTDQHPSHTYGVGGYHSVTLSITTADGCTYSTMQNNGVYFTPFGSNFYAIPQDTALPMPVQFYANSIGATGWLWDFGDGNSSTDENPLHIYTTNSISPVSLTIFNENCTLSYVSPLLNFGLPDSTPVDAGNPGVPEVQRGCAPLYVSFTQDYHVEGAMSYAWDFGDGGTSTEEFPSHTYQNAGVYSVYLLITDSVNRQIEVRLDSIIRVSGPRAGFQVIQSTNCQQAIVTFIDTSFNAATWHWEFGDSLTSSDQHPVHTYTGGQSNYIITQTVTDTAGCSSTISTSIFSNSQAPILVTSTDVCGLDTLNFFTSLRNYASYIWDFGDGNTSTIANPSHVYTQEGVFYPTLTTYDASGCPQIYTASPVTVNLPVAQFTTQNARQGCNRLAVRFQNTSQNGDLYEWDFGDGDLSSLENPTHTYVGAGIYTVSLNVYRGNCMSRITEPQYIKVDTAYAAFTATLTDICYPMAVHFQDASANAVSWSWTFSDRDTSSQANPTHVFNNYNFRNNILAIVDINGCRDTATGLPFSSLSADFEADSVKGCIPHTVNFRNKSTMAVRYEWNFGDGTTSTAPNPQHTYTQAGYYDVTLIVYAANNLGGCSDTLHIPAMIEAAQPVADFSTTDLYACAPSLVHFENLSQFADNYLWNFGDSTTSTNDTTSHIYQRPGIYTVSLIATSTAGCGDSIIKQQYIHVMGPQTELTASAYEGCQPFTVNFTDLSINASGWMWSFGDGYTSTDRNPVHVFQDTGTFTVALITTDTSGCSSFKELQRKIKVNPKPIASFQVPSTSGCAPFTTALTNTSSFYSSLSWNFGDGSSSTAENPNHTYYNAGNYDVSLIATNQFGCMDTAYAPAPIDVLTTPSAGFSAAFRNGCPPVNIPFFNTSFNTENASYDWNFGNGTTSTDANPTATYQSPGFYTVQLTVTNANGCSADTIFPACIQIADTLPPNETKIYSVSVSSNTTVEIIWENNPALDLAAYILYRLNGSTGFYEAIYTKTDLMNNGFELTSSYTDAGLNTLHNTYTYKVQAIDNCGYTIPLDQLTAHTTVNVSSYPSGTDIQVDWTPYGGCPVASYQIFRCIEGQSMQYLTTVDGNTLSYLDSTFDCPHTYSYRILATDLCGTVYTSYSDTSVTKPLDIFSEQTVNVVRSTVVDNEYVLTEWMQPSVLPEKVLQFDIYRSTDNINYTYHASVPAQQTDFIDHNVNVQEKNYFYKILVVNICNIEESLSQNTSTVVLKGEMDEARHVFLNWTPYVGWESGVDFYVLEKKDDNGIWTILKQVNGQTTQYDYQE